MTESFLDRRRSRRTRVSLPVILENATAVTRDASASSVFFWKRGTFMFEDLIRFVIERKSESGKILQKCRGVVVRTEPDDDGVGVAAKIVESTTERVSGSPAGPEMPDSAREEPPAIVRPMDGAPAPAKETISREAAREEPPTIAPPAEDKTASAAKSPVLDSAREEPPAVVPPTDDAPAPAETAALPESAREQAPTIAWPTDEASFLPEQERLPTIAWPTDEALFSPDKTVRLDTAREQPPAIGERTDGVAASASKATLREPAQEPPRVDTPPFNSAPAPADEIVSLDFVQEQARALTRARDDPLASAIETTTRWSSQLRGMALDAREELQGQELLEWDIPPAADATTVRFHRVTVCSVNVVGLRRDKPQVPWNRRILGVSYRDLARLRESGGLSARRSATGAIIGEESEFMNPQASGAGAGVRIELAICLDGSQGDRKAGKALQPRIVVRTTSVPAHHEQGSDTFCYEEASYSEPREAFEAFLALAGESAFLINLDLLGT